MNRLLLSIALLSSASSAVTAATIGPPLFDITRQCETSGRHNATAMSECIVAESEARSDILQHWSTYTDDGAEKCIKLSRKAKRLPYTAMAKCLSLETTSAGTSAAQAK